MMYVKYDAEEIKELIRQDVNKNNEMYKAAGEVFFTIDLEGRRERELVVTVTGAQVALKLDPEKLRG